MTDLVPACDHRTGCITCGDEAVPMRVVRVDEERMLALCADADGRKASVEIALVAPVAPGDELLVHAGTALHLTEGGAETRRSREAGGRTITPERGSGGPAEVFT